MNEFFTEIDVYFKISHLFLQKDRYIFFKNHQSYPDLSVQKKKNFPQTPPPHLIHPINTYSPHQLIRSFPHLIRPLPHLIRPPSPDPTHQLIRPLPLLFRPITLFAPSFT